jgi:molybdopterin/thiamine biosynthesis adenylyltransferase
MLGATSDEFYWERTDRNIGWITQDEQAYLRSCVVGIAGCGGMGGLLAITLARRGIGTLRVADSETFEISNLNRQYAARRTTLGKNKAIETARCIEEITPDCTVQVFSDGITDANVSSFAEDCTLIADEIEFWAVGSRIVLHQAARELGIPIFLGSSVGFGSRVFYFDHTGWSVDRMLGMNRGEARIIERSLQNKTATADLIERVLAATMKALIPALPRYGSKMYAYDDKEACLDRMRQEQRASILGSNPPFATGFLANWIVLQLLKNRFVHREQPALPRTPGYLYIDAAMLQSRIVTYEERIHDF